MSNKFNYPFNPIGWQAKPHDYTGDNNLNIYTAETTQRYMVGTRYTTWDGRVFRYARAGSNRTTGYGVSSHQMKFAGDGSTTSALTSGSAAVIGSNEINITVTATMGYASSGLVAEDELAGGFMVLMDSTPAHQFRGIIGNTAVPAGENTMTLYAEAPWNVAEDSGKYMAVWYNPYWDVRQIAEDYISVMGIPVVNITTGQFFWMQTWGPCRTSGHSANDGKTAGDRRVYFGPNGNFRPGDGVNRQLAGFYIERTSSSVAAGYCPLVMLQISP